MTPKEKAIEEGLAIQDLERSEGWAIIKSRINEETQALLGELRRIELDGRSLDSIGSDYISRIQRINGLERVLEILTEIKEAHEGAIRK